MKCADCQYWEKLNSHNNLGFCHLQPPHRLYEGDRLASSPGYPVTFDHDWCSQYANEAAQHRREVEEQVRLHYGFQR